MRKICWYADDMRKMREKMIEKVKKQYMDLLSEVELERILEWIIDTWLVAVV